MIFSQKIKIMKKLALLLCGIGSLAALSVYADNYSSPQPEPQYQEQCVPAPCYTDTVCNQLPCNVPVNCDTPVNCNAPVNCATPVNCAPDTVCAPAPCNVPQNAPQQAPAQSSTPVAVCC